jgi:hypothetical protein
MKQILPLGYQRWKLPITTAAMKVFPRPVGKHTSVLYFRQRSTMLNWYLRKENSG